MPKLKKEHARELLWERGDLRFKLHAGQSIIERAYRQADGPFFVANCSRRLGKTYWACVKAVETALTCKHSLPRIIYASATRLDLKNFVIPAFETILADCPDELRPVWRSSESKYVFPHNGAEILLVGLDKRPDGGRGNYCDLYVFEEAGFIQKLDYLYASVVYPMTITRPGSKILMASTPSMTPGHPFQEFCGHAQQTNSYAELTIYDNPLLTEEQIEAIKTEALRAGGETTWLREYMCQHVIDENMAIIPEWHPRYELEVVRPTYYPACHRYVAMDLGVKNDFTAILYGYYDTNTGILWVEDEDQIKGPAMTTPLLAQMVKDKEKELWAGLDGPYRRVSDNDNPLLMQDLGHLHDLHFTPTGKDELHAMINDVRTLIRGNKVRVDPRCKQLIGCLRTAIFENHQRKKMGHSAVYGHYDHLAALIYLVRNLDRHPPKIPDTYGMEKGPNLFERAQKERDEEEENLGMLLNMDE